MSATDASDSDSDHEVEVTTDFQTETIVMVPVTNPMTQEGLREDFTELLARLSRESLEREEEFRQQQLTASNDKRALLDSWSEDYVRIRVSILIRMHSTNRQ